jgi:endoglucanase
MNAEMIELIGQLIQAAGPSGYEDAVADIIRSHISLCGNVSTDGIGNIICEIPGKNPNGPRRLFVAHTDEIGFMVSDILENGFLRFTPVGGWNARTLPSSSVDVINTLGEAVPGVIGQIPPHFLSKNSSQVPEIEELFIDIGAKDRTQVVELFNIRIGSIIVPFGRFHHDQRCQTLSGKAFDDRIGVAALIELGKKVKESPCDATVVLAFTVQEEVGTRGAQVLANYIEADVAIIVEGAPADDVPGGPVNPQTCMGNGAHVRIFDPTHIGNPKLLQTIRNLTGEHHITIQEAVRKGGGTDAMVLALANKGIPSVVTGVPVRYAHSHTGMIALSDYVNLVELLYAICRDSSWNV